MSAKKIWAIIISLLIILGAVGWIAYEIKTETKADEISAADAESFLNEAFDSMAISEPTKLIAQNNNITVNSISYGSEKDIIIDCTVNTLDVYSVVSPRYDEFLRTNARKPDTGMFKSALNFKQEFEEAFVECVNSSPEKTVDCIIKVYQTNNGLRVYSSDGVVDMVYGGVNRIASDVLARETYTDANGEAQKFESENVKKGVAECFSLRYENDKPDVSNKLIKTWNSLKKDFHRNFIQHNRWETIFKGLWVTIKLTLFSLLIGIFIGFIVALIRCTYIKNPQSGIVMKIVMKILNAISQVYLTVIRGTPAMVQIMIIYFVIFMPMGVDKFVAAVICFGLNSGAYVAEIVRGGIMSIDDGQTEAGRSLGFGYMSTMFYIVFPQAFKAVLPALANEFVVLLKETSIAFYIGLGDLMYSVNAIRAATYSQFMPLIAAALIYFVMVLGLSKLVSLLERRLRNNER